MVVCVVAALVGLSSGRKCFGGYEGAGRGDDREGQKGRGIRRPRKDVVDSHTWWVAGNEEQEDGRRGEAETRLEEEDR